MKKLSFSFLVLSLSLANLTFARTQIYVAKPTEENTSVIDKFDLNQNRITTSQNIADLLDLGEDTGNEAVIQKVSTISIGSKIFVPVKTQDSGHENDLLYTLDAETLQLIQMLDFRREAVPTWACDLHHLALHPSRQTIYAFTFCMERWPAEPVRQSMAQIFIIDVQTNQIIRSIIFPVVVWAGDVFVSEHWPELVIPIVDPLVWQEEVFQPVFNRNGSRLYMRTEDWGLDPTVYLTTFDTVNNSVISNQPIPHEHDLFDVDPERGLFYLLERMAPNEITAHLLSNINLRVGRFPINNLQIPDYSAWSTSFKLNHAGSLLYFYNSSGIDGHFLGTLDLTNGRSTRNDFRLQNTSVFERDSYLKIDPSDQRIFIGDIFFDQLRKEFVLLSEDLGTTFAFDPDFPANTPADLAVSAVDIPDPVCKNCDLTYKITVKNHGPGIATSFDVNIALPAGATFVRANTDSRGKCQLSPLNANTVLCKELQLNSPGDASITVQMKAPKVVLPNRIARGVVQAIMRRGTENNVRNNVINIDTPMQ